MANSNVSVTDTYDALLTTTLRNYRKTLVDNVYRELPLLFWLKNKGRSRQVNGGYQIMIPVLYGINDTVQMYDKYDVLNVTPQEGMTTAKYDWKQMAVSIAISRKEELMNNGPAQLIDLLRAKVTQAEKSMQWVLADMLHGRFGSEGKTFVSTDSNSVNSVGETAASKLSSNGFNSLDHFVRSYLGMVDIDTTAARSHTVGGITVSITTDGAPTSATDYDTALAVTAQTNPWWMNYSIPGFGRLQRTGSGGSPNLGAVPSSAESTAAGYISSGYNLITVMRSLYNRLSDGADHPDVGLTSKEVYELYEGSLVANERFMDMSMGDAGFANLKFKGMTLMFDHGITTPLPTSAYSVSGGVASNIPVPLYMLNGSYLEWITHTQADFYNTPFYRPENQDARTSQILLMGNLCTSNRSKHGVIACGNLSTYYTA